MARYITSAHYEDMLVIRTRLGDLRSRGLRFDYKIVRARDNLTLATGYSRHICITHAGQPTRIPETIMTHLAPVAPAP